MRVMQKDGCSWRLRIIWRVKGTRGGCGVRKGRYRKRDASETAEKGW
jgi:hypothetical protein